MFQRFTLHLTGRWLENGGPGVSRFHVFPIKNRDIPASYVRFTGFGILVPMFGGGIDPILTVIFFKQVGITN